MYTYISDFKKLLNMFAPTNLNFWVCHWNHPTSIFHTRIEDCVEIEQKPRSEHALTADGGTLPFLEQKENPMHLNHMHYHNVT
jgi:hypothetical protein